MYMMLKHLHLTAVGLSIFLFVFRFIWAQFDSGILAKTWVKVVPHVIDTLLLASAIGLCITLSQYPLTTTWLTLKVLGVVLYIVLGLFALKKAKTTVGKWGCFIGALVVVMLTASVAFNRHSLF